MLLELTGKDALNEHVADRLGMISVMQSTAQR